MSSGETEGEQAPAVKKVYRTVTPPYRGRGDTEMTTIGFAYIAVLLVLLVPLLPFMLLAWAFGKVLDFLKG